MSCIRAAILLFLLVGTPARGADPEPWIETSVEGRIVGSTLAHDGRRDELLLLVSDTPRPLTWYERRLEQADGPAQPPPCPENEWGNVRLLLGRTTEGDESAVLRDPLPPDTTGIAALDLDGDGSDEWLLVRRGSIDVVSRRGVEHDRTLVEHDAFDIRGVRSVRVESGHLMLRGARGQQVFLPRDGTLVEAMRVATDLRAFTWSSLLAIRWRPVTFVGESEGVRTFLARAAEERANRVRVERVDLRGDGTVAETTAWLKLPEPEDTIESIPLLLDGAPHVLLTTKPAGKLGLMGEKRLRLYPVSHDRTRLGTRPVWETESRMNQWQAAHVELYDADGDGRKDLVIGYWKGIKDSRVVLDTYLREETGFRKSARTTGFDVRGGDRSFLSFEHDLDGDGRRDLLVASEGGLFVYRGKDPDSRALVEKPAVVLPYPVTDVGESTSISIGANVQAAVERRGGPVGIVELADGSHAILATRLPEKDVEGDRIALVRVPPASGRR